MSLELVLKDSVSLLFFEEGNRPHEPYQLCVVVGPEFGDFRRRNSKSEILAKHFADMGEKRGAHLAIFFAEFSSFNFQEEWAKEISRKILDKFHEPSLRIPKGT